MPNLQELKASSPAYASMSDAEFAERVYQKHYADKMSLDDFKSKAGMPSFANVRNGSDKAQEAIAKREAARVSDHPIGSALGEIGGRQVLQGAAGLFGAIGGDALNHYVMQPLGLSDGRTYRQAASDLADNVGMRQPQTSGERIASDIGEGLTGTALTMGAGSAMGAGSKLGQFLTAQPVLQGVSTATGAGASGAVRENGGGQGAQTLAGLVGGIAPGGATAANAMGLRGLLRGGERGRQAMRQGIDDFRAVGAQPSVGQATGNRRTQGLESLLAGAPTSGGVMARAAERQADDIGAGLRSKADQFMPNASAERAGRAVEKGADTFAGNVKATRKALYWQADKLIPDTVTLPLQRTQMALADLTTAHQGAMATTGALVNPKIAQMARNVSDDLAANGGAMPYAAVKELRSKIGEELSDFSLVADKPTAQYKRLYAALSQDLEESARQQGPAAAQAAHRANAYTRASAERLEQVQRVVDKNGGPEKVYNAVMAGTQDGGTTLRAVMQSLPPEGQRAVTGGVIKRMGLATPGQQGAAGETFSAQTFLTNWNKVSPEARKALFDRHGAKFSADMDRIARVADRIKDGSKVFANPSGTANRVAGFTYLGSLGVAGGTGQAGAFGALLAGGLAANLTARAFTSPKVVDWLAKQTALPAGALASQIAVLARIGKDDPEAAELAEALQNPSQ